MPDQREILMQYLAQLQAGQQPQIPQGVPPNVGAAAVMARPPALPWGPEMGQFNFAAIGAPEQNTLPTPERMQGDRSPISPRWLTGADGATPPGAGYQVYGSSIPDRRIDLEEAVATKGMTPEQLAEWNAKPDDSYLPTTTAPQQQPESTLPLGKPEIPRKQPFERPKGEPVDPGNPEHAELQQEASTRGMEKVKEALQTRDESKLSKRDKLLAMRDIAEGLGSWKPSVAADYLLTGGPPEQPTASTTTIDLDLAKEEDLRSGEDLRAALAESGIEMPKNIPLSVYREMFPMLMTMNRQEEKDAAKAASERRWEITKAESERRWEITQADKATAKDESARRWEKTQGDAERKDRVDERDRFRQDSNVKTYKKNQADAKRALKLVRSDNPMAHKGSVIQIVRGLGDTRISENDIKRWNSRWGAWETFVDTYSRVKEGDWSEKQLGQIDDMLEILIRSHSRDLHDAAKDYAKTYEAATKGKVTAAEAMTFYGVDEPVFITVQDPEFPDDPDAVIDLTESQYNEAISRGAQLEEAVEK